MCIGFLGGMLPSMESDAFHISAFQPVDFPMMYTELRCLFKAGAYTTLNNQSILKN